METSSQYLEPGRDPLVHLKVLFGAVERAIFLSPGDGARGEVPDAVPEAQFAQAVIVGHEVADRPDLVRVDWG